MSAMSIAGVRSWRGDEFQLRVAMNYLIRVLAGELAGLQVESVGLPGYNEAIEVDDVVALLCGDLREYVQVKKNQQEYESWKLKDCVFRAELVSARDQLERDATGVVRFFSRSPFGELQKLKEEADPCPDLAAFKRNVGRGVAASLSKLAAILERSESQTLDLVRRIRFGAVREFDGWDAENLRELQRIVPSALTAQAVLERFLGSHQSHLRDSKFVISREDIIAELARHHLAPAPLYGDQETLELFARSSQIGRQWLRDIAGKRFSRTELRSIIGHIETGKKTVLVAAAPGCGKTCLLLDLADELEADETTAVLFVKGDRFAGVEDEGRLQDNGLPPDIVGRCARLAVSRRVVVILDSLDVLSISRNHGSLRVFLGLLERLENLDGVSIVAACRNFDLKYDPQLRGKKWQAEVQVALRDYEIDVAPLLKEWNIEPSALSAEMRVLLCVPQHLRLFHRLVESHSTKNLVSAFQLYECFIEETVTGQPGLGDEVLRELEEIAASGIHQRRHTFPRAGFDVAGETLRLLISNGILIETEGGSLAFAHQTIAECLAVRRAVRKGQTLAQFILTQPPLPFVRPAVRTFFFSLRNQARAAFRRQIWEVLNHGDIAYHLKRLMAESFAELSPEDEDWPLVRRLFTDQPTLFQRTVAQARNDGWFNLLHKNWLPMVKQGTDTERWRYLYLGNIERWLKSHSKEVVAIWTDSFEAGWAPDGSAWRMSIALSSLTNWNIDGLQRLFELLAEKDTGRDMLSKPLSSWVTATGNGDALIWRYITRKRAGDAAQDGRARMQIDCAPHSFHHDTFLIRRLLESDEFMTLALDYLQAAAADDTSGGLSNHILNETSWKLRRTRMDTLPADGSTMLIGALETAFRTRANRNDAWWQQQEPQLRQTANTGLRFLLLEGYRENPLANLAGIEAQLADRDLFRVGPFEYELGELMAVAYGYISIVAQDRNQALLLELAEDIRDEDGQGRAWSTRRIYHFSLWIPRPFRSPGVVEFLERWQMEFGSLRSGPRIHAWGGAVSSPVSKDQLSALDNASLIRLLGHYLVGGHYGSELSEQSGMVGGISEVRSTVRQCAAADPARFLTILEDLLDDKLARKFGPPILEGIAEHVRYVAVSRSAPQGWLRPADGPTAEELARALAWHAERALSRPTDLIGNLEYSTATILQAAADGAGSDETADRLTLALWRLVNSDDPSPRLDEEAADFAMASANSTRGVVASSAMKLLCRAVETQKPIPRLLEYLVRRFASDPSLGVRVSILERLAFVAHHRPELGWAVFADCFRNAQGKLWAEAERLLYYQYRDSFDRLKPLLERMIKEAPEAAGGTYGRIATLSYLAGHAVADGAPFLSLATNDRIRQGVAEVLCSNLGHGAVAEKCRSTLIEMLQLPELASAAIIALGRAMAKEGGEQVDRELAKLSADALTHAPQARDTWGLCKWLERNCARYPRDALEICEKIVAIPGEDARMRFSGEMVRVLIEVLKEADETDDPTLIARAVKLQDDFLRLEVAGVDELLDNSALS